MNNITQEYIGCECKSPEHNFLLTLDQDDKTLILTIFLANNYPWYIRVLKAIKYVFGYKCRYGHFDEMIVDSSNSTKLFELMKKFKEFHTNQNKQ